MSFKEKYPIAKNYLTSGSKRRSGELISPRVMFVVAHDTGNANSTAAGNVRYYENSRNELSASAHIFVDDKEIIECVPALTVVTPEKAWHVRYDQTQDNQLYGDDANDVAIGVEYCFGNNINSAEAYARYVWVLAYICYKFNLDPHRSVVGHSILDPGRRTDPQNGLAQSGRNYEQLLKDIVIEYNACVINEQYMMKLIKNTSSNKIYAIGNDNKKHWIFNMETFNVGKQMGLWGDMGMAEIKNDDPHEEGHSILLVK